MNFFRLLYFSCFLISFNCLADSKTFDDIEINWSIFNSSFIEPKVANIYGFTRANDRALLNISILKGTQAPQVTQPAEITGTWYDLIHKKNLNFKEIKEQNAVYYIAEFPIDHRTTYYFDLTIKSEGKEYKLQFNKLLYIEGK